MISILMPVKNTGRYLSDCIESILSQTYELWELIAVDDFSDDNSYQLLQQYAEKDSRIKVLKNSEKGIIPALQLAYKHSEGNWISRMDADDRMPPQKLELFAKHAQEGRLVTGKVKYFGEAPVSEGYLRYENWLNALTSEEYGIHVYRECVVASPNWLISKEFFESFNWNSWKYPEDYDLIFHWRKAGYEVLKLEEVTHLWREHPDRTSRKSERYQQESFFQLKTKWFVKEELTDGEEVQVVGSAQKSKLVSKSLTEMKVSHQLFSVYGEAGRSVEDLNSKKKAILCAWPIDKKKQLEIKSFLESKGFEFGKNIWLF